MIANRQQPANAPPRISAVLSALLLLDDPARSMSVDTVVVSVIISDVEVSQRVATTLTVPDDVGTGEVKLPKTTEELRASAAFSKVAFVNRGSP